MVKERNFVKQDLVTLLWSTDDGFHIFEGVDGKEHEISIGELTLGLIIDASGLCSLSGLSHENLDCS